MLITLNANNTHGEKAERTFFTESVALIGEQHQEPTNLYNVDGDLVSSTPAEDKIFFVLFKREYGIDRIIIDQANRDLLVKALSK